MIKTTTYKGPVARAKCS